MTTPQMTVGGTTILIRSLSKPRIAIKRRPHLAAQPVYGANKDDVEHMGNSGRMVRLQNCVLYDSATPANALIWAQALQSWCDNGTSITFQSATEPVPFSVRLAELEIVEGSGQGFEYSATLVET